MKRVKLCFGFSLFCLLCLTGCGQEFDASAYVKAVLDCSYKNNIVLLAELSSAPEEDIRDMRKKEQVEFLEEMTGGFIRDYSLTDETVERYLGVLDKILLRADYTVGEARKQEDGSYVVCVYTRRMRITEPAMERFSYEYQIYRQFVEDGGSAMQTQEERAEHLAVMMLESIEAVLPELAYEDTVCENDVHICLSGGEWTIRQEDLELLREQLFD